MTPLPAALQAAALALVALAAYTDLRWRLIPNWLVASGFVLGLLLSVLLLGAMAGLRHAALGSGLALLVYAPLFTLRAAGGGDLKLMAALGSIVGPGNWFTVFFLTAMLGGVAALMLVLLCGRLRATLRNVGYIVGALVCGRKPHNRRPEVAAGHPASLGLPHGAVIAVATCLLLLALKGGAGAR